MGTVDFLNAPMLKNAGLDNTERPAADFFGRLKNADDAAFETRALFVQIAQRPQKPGSVTVVTAGVAAHFCLTFPWICRIVRHRKRINVGAQRHCCSRRRSIDDNHYAALNLIGIHMFKSPAFEGFDDQINRTGRLETEFRMSMNVTAQSGKLVRPLNQFRKCLVGKNGLHGCISNLYLYSLRCTRRPACLSRLCRQGSPNARHWSIMPPTSEELTSTNSLCGSPPAHELSMNAVIAAAQSAGSRGLQTA